MDRLYNDAANRIERNMQKSMTIHETQHNKSTTSDPYTFHPNVNQISKLLADNNDMYQGDFKDFQSRQNEFIAR